MEQQTTYNANSIAVLEGLEAVESVRECISEVFLPEV